jgi:hypothetical protein
MPPFPPVPRLMALNVVGNVDDTVAVISPSVSSLYLAVQGTEVQTDMLA